MKSDKHEIIACSRCNSAIECKSNTPWSCDCNSVQLTNEEAEFIAEKFYDGCLCQNCLKQLKEEYQRQTVQTIIK